jgi:hypothetical protein
VNTEVIPTTAPARNDADFACGQLDLFLDSKSVSLVNEVVAALCARDVARAGAATAALREHTPEHESLSAFELLTTELAERRIPDADADAIAAAVRRIELGIAPAARHGLGSGADSFVGTFFRQLSDAARGLAYSGAQPTTHRAWLCLRCGDWPQAEEAAQAIPRATTTPDALEWLAIARYRQRGLAAARAALFALAWHAPQRLASTLAELRDELLIRDWRRFSVASEWNTVPDDDLAAWFPAWYQLEHPAVSRELDFFDAPMSPPAEAARLLSHIFGLESRGEWRKLAVHRERLRALNAEFFALYMARRAVNHR